MTYVGHSVARTLIRARFSPLHSTGQRFIVSGSASGSIFIYDVLTGQVHSELEHHQDICRDVSWHPFDSSLISSSVCASLLSFSPSPCQWDGTVVQWSYHPMASASASPMLGAYSEESENEEDYPYYELDEDEDVEGEDDDVEEEEEDVEGEDDDDADV